MVFVPEQFGSRAMLTLRFLSVRRTWPDDRVPAMPAGRTYGLCGLSAQLHGDGPAPGCM